MTDNVFRDLNFALFNDSWVEMLSDQFQNIECLLKSLCVDLNWLLALPIFIKGPFAGAVSSCTRATCVHNRSMMRRLHNLWVFFNQCCFVSCEDKFSGRQPWEDCGKVVADIARPKVEVSYQRSLWWWSTSIFPANSISISVLGHLAALFAGTLEITRPTFIFYFHKAKSWRALAGVVTPGVGFEAASQNFPTSSWLLWVGAFSLVTDRPIGAGIPREICVLAACSGWTHCVLPVDDALPLLAGTLAVQVIALPVFVMENPAFLPAPFCLLQPVLKGFSIPPVPVTIIHHIGRYVKRVCIGQNE